MPSRKQRRRRQKERRHEYEYVYVDERGQELPVEEPEPAAAAKNGAGATRTRGRAQTGSRTQTGARTAPARKIDPPSWRRVAKRTLIFAPIMFVTIALLDRKLSLAGQLLVTLQLLVLFVPFSYLMDRLLYRRYVRQTGGMPAAPRRRS
ncbi:MAG: hypothetical protein M3322_02545 [Actinomycetota bacterium]|nr:hypothetical protein [Actinomycetota bacterium]